MIDSKLRSFLKASFPALRIAIVRLISVGFSLAMSILIARQLGPTEFGAYTILMAVGSLGGVVLGFGIPLLLEREVATARGTGETAGTATVLAAMSWIAAFHVILVGLALLLPHPFALPLVLYAICSVAGSISGALLRGYEKVETPAIVDGVWRPAVALTAIAYLALLPSSSATTFLWVQVGSLACSLLLLIALLQRLDMSLIRRAWKCQTNDRSRSAASKATLTASINLSAVQLLINLAPQAEILWLTALASPEVVAYFFAATRAASAVGIFHAAVLAAAMPTIIRTHALGDIAARNQLIGDTTRRSALLVVTVASIAALLGPYYLMFFGAEYKQAFPAMIIMLVSWTLISMAGPVNQIMLAHKRDHIIWLAIALGLLAGGATALILIPSFGLIGAATSYFVTSITSHAILLCQVHSLTGHWLLFLLHRESDDV